MGQWGEAFGVPFAFEGCSSSPRRSSSRSTSTAGGGCKPWAHFWTGVPIVIAGIFGSVSVVAANAWMNSPSGLHARLGGQRRRRRPGRVIFNDAMPLMAAHMVVAAYLVGGFLIASVYAIGHAARATRPLPPARLHHPVHGRSDRHTRSRWASATRWPAGCTTTSRRSSPPSSWCRRPSSDVPETLLGHLNASGQVVGGVRHPRAWRRGLSDPSTGTATVVQGLDSFPADARPTHPRGATSSTCAGTSWLAWARCCSCCTLWYWASWIFRRDMPQSRWFLRVAAVAGVLSVVTLEAGWMVSEVGRQPWIVYNMMKVADAATANTGVWMTFIAVAILVRGARHNDDSRVARMSRRVHALGNGFERDRRPVRAAGSCRVSRR